MIVCFYAHKGGSGRSAAVANIAPTLSSAGYRVLIVDFDLEAPGVHRFFGLQDEDCKGGVVDLVEEHTARVAAGGEIVLPEFPEHLLLEPVFKPIKTIDGAELSAEQVRDRLLGARTIGTTVQFEAGVKVLPAGRLDADYRRRVSAIDWSSRWNDPAWRVFFGWLKLELQARAEVVLLDARAGVTELGALCLFALADHVVLLTPPTFQGLDGAIATAKALGAAGRGPADHGTLLIPSRVSKDADREHLGRWLREAREQVRAPELLKVWTETANRTAPNQAAEEMLERFMLPELPVHAVGEPLVVLRMLERGVQHDDLQERYALLGGTIQRWVADTRRNAATLEGLQAEHEVQERIEAARAERRFEELPGLYGRLAELKLEHPRSWAQAREAAELARKGAATAALQGDEDVELHLKSLEGRALLEAQDPVGAERVLAEAARRLQPRQDVEWMEAQARWGQALAMMERDEEAEPLLREVWEAADVSATPESVPWRALARYWSAVSPMNAGRLQAAWSIIHDLDPAGDLALRRSIVSLGVALAQELPQQQAHTVLERCRGLALQPPRQPDLLAKVQFCTLTTAEDRAIAGWSVVLNTFAEGVDTDPSQPMALIQKALRTNDLKERRLAVRKAIQLLDALPYPPSQGCAACLMFWTQVYATESSSQAEGLAHLERLRSLVSTGKARRRFTQSMILQAHANFVGQTPERANGVEIATALTSAMRTRRWSELNGGWRSELQPLGELIEAIARCGTLPPKSPESALEKVFLTVATWSDGGVWVPYIILTGLSPEEQHSFLTKALRTPGASQTFKDAVHKLLFNLGASPPR